MLTSSHVDETIQVASQTAIDAALAQLDAPSPPVTDPAESLSLLIDDAQRLQYCFRRSYELAGRRVQYTRDITTTREVVRDAYAVIDEWWEFTFKGLASQFDIASAALDADASEEELALIDTAALNLAALLQLRGSRANADIGESIGHVNPSVA